MAKKTYKAEPPGEIFQQGKGWWWKVRLPGEKRIRERALKPEGARFAAEKIEEAQEIALGLWQAAIERTAKAEVRAQAWARAKKKARAHAREIAQIKAEAAETIARQKAMFDKEVDAYTETLTEAQEKAKAVTEARAQAEARAREKDKSHADEIAQIKAGAAETIARQKAMFAERVDAYTKAVTEAQEKAKAQTEARAQAEAKLAEMLSSTVSTGTCECCGRDDISENDLVRIDSGQLFCPDCLEALRA